MSPATSAAAEDPPVTVAALLDYALRVRNELDDEGDSRRDEALNLIQVRKVCLYAERFELARPAESPEAPISRAGAARILDEIISRLRDFLSEEAANRLICAV